MSRYESKTVFIVRLKEAHDKKGLSPYAVAKQTGVAINTVARYADQDAVVSKHLAVSVIKLCDFYGLDWRDPSVVEVVEDTETESTPAAA